MGERPRNRMRTVDGSAQSPRSGAFWPGIRDRTRQASAGTRKAPLMGRTHRGGDGATTVARQEDADLRVIDDTAGLLGSMGRTLDAGRSSTAVHLQGRGRLSDRKRQRTGLALLSLRRLA
jgi:hypothetical protein